MTGKDGVQPPNVAAPRPNTPVRRALRKTLAGVAISLMVLVLFWTFEFCVPEIEAWSVDAGLRMSAAVDRIAHQRSGMQPDGSNAYVFLDVDPNDLDYVSDDAQGSPSQRVCNASGNSWACAPGRPINRSLLANVVRRLNERAPNLIVLDVALAPEGGVVPKEEDDELRAALCDSQVRVLFPATVLGIDSGRTPPYPFARLLENGQGVGHCAGGKRIETGIAYPSPGSPVRRYPRCFRTSGGALLPSLPYRAARSSSLTARAEPAICDDAAGDIADPEPRIAYTLPGLLGHERSDPASDAGRQWSFYRQLYTRCLGTDFWDERASCGGKELYEGRVVVVGASSAARRDRHATPLGDMSGAEITINALRSFELYSDAQLTEPSFLARRGRDLLSLGLGAGIWFLCSWWEQRRWRGGLERAVALVVTHLVILAAGFLLARGYQGSLPSVDVLVPLLAAGAEVYIEKACSSLHWIEARLRSL